MSFNLRKESESYLQKTMQLWMGRRVICNFKEWLGKIRREKIWFDFFYEPSAKYLKEVPYDVLEVLDILVRPVDVVEPRNLNQPTVVVAVDIVADCPGVDSEVR